MDISSTSLQSTRSRIIYDPIYGFIKLTPWEWEIVHTPFYQRLRWIKQLGFACYTFYGAEHSRFGHSIGVMFNAHKILETVGLGVDESQLMNPAVRSEAALFHKNLRLAALLHDLGTFPFSHTTEMAYIKFGQTHSANTDGRVDNHEHLGSFIIKNTPYEGGVTSILEKYGFDPQEISNLVKGVSKSIIANQILHSEIDCDRMDYLLRDAHYTGLNYGTYDRDYLLHHFKAVKVGAHRVLTIKINALHCVEDFLTSRFAWYSQVVRSARGSKYDKMAEYLCGHLLEHNEVYRYGDLLEMISKGPNEFYAFNDHYFMQSLQKHCLSEDSHKKPKVREMAFDLLFERGPRTLRMEEFHQRLLGQDNAEENQAVLKKVYKKMDEINHIIEKKGDKKDWVLFDIPDRDIIFIKSHKSIVKANKHSNVLLERDPVKISTDSGEIKLLAEVQNSIFSRLGNVTNFIPNAFCSESAYQLLIQEGIKVE